MAIGEERDHSVDAISFSRRDAAAEQRDRAADDRDLAAQLRDLVDCLAQSRPLSAERGAAARDREAAARDRAHAARDRESARHDLANEGIDALTGVMGRRVGLAALQREIDRSERTGEPLVVAFVDTVGLKAINDSRGHAAGDRVLQDVAGSIRSDLRSYDLVARVGGDEFICSLAGQNLDQAGARYRKLAASLATKQSGAGVTVGFAALEPGDSLEDLVNRADQAMLGVRR